jgi:serine racemase
MPNNAPLPKKNAVKHTYQATVFECEPNNKARAEMTERKRKELKYPIFIHPSNDPRVIAGQGTIALELIEQTENLDAVIVPLGGGGMISGIATAIKALNSDIKVYGVEPTNASDALRAKQAGDAAWDGSSKHKKGVPVQTCADGLKTVLLENNWPIVRDKVDDIFDVSETEILYAMEMIVSRMKLAIEPSAATGFALARSDKFKSLGHSRVGIVLCGGNADYSSVFEELRKKYC